MCERLAQLGEEKGRDPESVEISTVHRTKASNSDAAAEDLADELGSLAEAGVELCILSVSPAEPDALAWISGEVVPRLGAPGR